MQLNCFLFARTSGRLHAPPRRGLTGRVYPRLISASAGRGNPQKSRGKNSSEEAAGARLRASRLAPQNRACVGFLPSRKPTRKTGLPQQHWRRRAGPCHTQTLAYLRMRRMQARIWCFSRTLTIVIFVGLGAISLLGGIP